MQVWPLKNRVLPVLDRTPGFAKAPVVETTDFNSGRFSKTWGPVENWQDAILQVPHLHVATPFFKSPNSTMRHNHDWTDIDLDTLEQAALPVTSYKPAGDRDVYDANYTHWDIDGESVPAHNK